MTGGATLIAPDTVFLSMDTKIGRDVLIEPHVVFGPGVSVDDGVVIHAFSHLEGARVARRRRSARIARLRPGADIAARRGSATSSRSRRRRSRRAPRSII